MLTFLSVILVTISIGLKNKVWLFILMYSSALLVYSLALDGMHADLWHEMFVKDVVYLSLEIYWLWVVLFISNLVFVFFLSNAESCYKVVDYRYVEYLKLVAFLFMLLSLSAGGYSWYLAGDINLMLSNPREWEMKFGVSVVRNYFYFLHLPALVIFGFVYKYSSFIGKWVCIFCITILLLLTFIHGIKFTIIHGFMFLSFSFFVANNERVPKSVYLLLLMLILTIILFFVFVRGGGVDGLVGYIVSASVNSMYEVNKSLLFVGDAWRLTPFNLESLSRIYIRLLGEFPVRETVGLPESFALNDKYNLQNAITVVGFGGGCFFIVLSYMLAVVINLLRRQYIFDVRNLYFKVFILSALVMLFTAWEFSKTKLWYVFLCLFIVHYFYVLVVKSLCFGCKYKQ